MYVSTAVRNWLKTSGLKLQRGHTSPSISWWQTSAERHAPSRPQPPKAGANGQPLRGMAFRHGHWDRRLNATQSSNFKPLVFGEIHAAGNMYVNLRKSSLRIAFVCTTLAALILPGEVPQAQGNLPVCPLIATGGTTQ